MLELSSRFGHGPYAWKTLALVNCLLYVSQDSSERAHGHEHDTG